MKVMFHKIRSDTVKYFENTGTVQNGRSINILGHYRCVKEKNNIFTWLSLQKQTFSDFENREKDKKKQKSIKTLVKNKDNQEIV